MTKKKLKFGDELREILIVCMEFCYTDRDHFAPSVVRNVTAPQPTYRSKLLQRISIKFLSF